MNELTQGILWSLGLALIVSVTTAYITVKLSVKQFYSQRLWEKKAEAYSHIMEHLSYLQYNFGEWADELVGLSTLSKEQQRKLSEGYLQSKEAITKAAAIGAYVVSDTTTAALAELLRELSKEDPSGNWFADNDRYYGAVKQCIRIIREDAKVALSNK